MDEQKRGQVISTKHNANVTTINRRIWGKHRETEGIKKPICINDYNAHISGVNQVDQMISYYPCTQKFLKWTKKVFYYLMEISVHSSLILYKTMTTATKNLTLHEFQLKSVKTTLQMHR